MKTLDRNVVRSVEPDYRERIERGALLLDERFGTSWRSEVNTRSLRLDDGTTCVLGQVFVERIVNGATSGVGEHWIGGKEYLFPLRAFVLVAEAYGTRPGLLQDQAAAHYGFLLTDSDEAEWGAYCEDFSEASEKQPGGSTIHWLYEVLTKQWVEYLTNPATI